jgi:hypothetical protein
MIDSGANLQLWAADSRQLTKRKAVLDKARSQLTGPQPARKKLKRPSRHVTDLTTGEVLAYRGSNNQLALLRVGG